MNAGILAKRVIEVYGMERVQSTSGYEEERPQLLYKCRCYLKKRSYMQDRDRVQGYEQFDGSMLTLKVRQDKRLDKAVEIKYKGVRYAILQRIEQEDRAELLMCRKLDD